MTDAVGVEIEKGDLLIVFTPINGSMYIRYAVAIDFTNSFVIIGLTEKNSWTARQTRPKVSPNRTVVVNHAWDSILKHNNNSIKELLEKSKITPNKEIKKPLEDVYENKSSNEENLEEI